MAWLSTIVAVLAVLLLLACWAIHLLFQQGRRNTKISLVRAGELEEAIKAQRLRIEELDREVDAHKMRSDKQAEFIYQQGLANPVHAFNPDGTPRTLRASREFVIHEEP